MSSRFASVRSFLSEANWGAPSRRRRQRPGLWQTERLEDRTLLTIDIVFDYTYDTNGFFNDVSRRESIEMAARTFEEAFSDDLVSINPTGGNSWTADFKNPQTGSQVSISNLKLKLGEVRIYVGARNLPGSQVGEASSGWSASGTAAWLKKIQYRGESTAEPETGPWGGSIAFDSLVAWHSGITTEGIDNHETDLYSVAMHELGHLLGYLSNSTAWTSQVQSSRFNGPNAKAVNNNQGIPVGAGGHLQDNLQSDGTEVNMSPTGLSGRRNGFTSFDWAVLDDLGWTLRFNEANPRKYVPLTIQVVDGNGVPQVNKSVILSGTGGVLTNRGKTDSYGMFTTIVRTGTWTIKQSGKTTPVNVSGQSYGIRIRTDGTIVSDSQPAAMIAASGTTGETTGGTNAFFSEPGVFTGDAHWTDGDQDERVLQGCWVNVVHEIREFLSDDVVDQLRSFLDRVIDRLKTKAEEAGWWTA